MIKKLICILGIVLAGQLAWAEEFRPYAEGLPLPWPFPWAEGCPAEWAALDGTYVLKGRTDQDTVEIKITVGEYYGMGTMQISRYSPRGTLLSDGWSFLWPRSRYISIYLWPRAEEVQPMKASLKFHFNKNFNCQISQLVPILTIEEMYSDHTNRTQFRLVRQPIEELEE